MLLELQRNMNLRDRLLTHRAAPAVAFAVMISVQLGTLALKVFDLAPGLAGLPIDSGPDGTPRRDVAYLGAFLLACATVIVVGRYWPRFRDATNALLGAAFALIVGGPVHATMILALAAIIYFVAPRFNGYVSMVGTIVLLLLAFRYVVPASNWHVHWHCLRLVSFAFEAKSARKRSFVSFLAYAPFGLLLMTGVPVMISYLTYTTKRSREELDLMGTKQLLLGAAKVIALIAVYDFFASRITSLEAFLSSPLWLRLAMFPGGYALAYLFLSSLCDFNTGCSNLAGYLAPAAFNAPFLADTPFEFWRRWNVHVMGFLRATCLFPLGKRKVPVAIIAFIAMTASGALHFLAECFDRGKTMTRDDLVASLIQNASFPFIGIILLVTIPWEKNRNEIKHKWIGVVVTQAFYCAFFLALGINLIVPTARIDTLKHLHLLREMF